MKRIIPPLFLLLLFPMLLPAQFRGEEPRRPSVAEGVYQESGGAILGFFHPENLQMRHSLSLSYGMMGDQGLGVSMYTNSLRYRISEPLSVRADISMMFSPFGSASQMFKNDISGVFLRRASIDYEPRKDMKISLQYRAYPYGTYNPYDGGYGRYGMYNSVGLFPSFGDDEW
ncbi:MAG: hypothetical protein RRA94_00060 [Bacteroidota bacterium]|nr:hypothetical protein [Bacteroidota bacterium]